MEPASKFFIEQVFEVNEWQNRMASNKIPKICLMLKKNNYSPPETKQQNEHIIWIPHILIRTLKTGIDMKYAIIVEFLFFPHGVQMNLWTG